MARAVIERQLLEAGLCTSVVESLSSRLVVDCAGGEHAGRHELFFKVGTGGAAAGLSELEYEAEGLRRLHAAAEGTGVIVPRPWLVGEIDAGNAFIVMEHVDMRGGAGGGGSAARALGAGLARIHNKPATHPAFGFPRDGVCGALEQLNNAEGRQLNWVEFWSEYRLGAQLRVAEARHPAQRRLQELGAQLLKRLPELFVMLPPEQLRPSLLHGDLWSGNWGADATGTPVMCDPAAYYGHAEADHGIAHMFGGFPPAFWDAYFEVRPKAPGYERRAALYELHHHLNHLNIFGAGYAGGAEEMMVRCLQG